MIYDNKTLEKLSLEKLKELESTLIDDLKLHTKHWLCTYADNEIWGHAVEVDVVCLKNVRKHIKIKL